MAEGARRRTPHAPHFLPHSETRARAARVPRLCVCDCVQRRRPSQPARQAADRVSAARDPTPTCGRRRGARYPTRAPAPCMLSSHALSRSLSHSLVRLGPSSFRPILPFTHSYPDPLLTPERACDPRACVRPWRHLYSQRFPPLSQYSTRAFAAGRARLAAQRSERAVVPCCHNTQQHNTCVRGSVPFMDKSRRTPRPPVPRVSGRLLTTLAVSHAAAPPARRWPSLPPHTLPTKTAPLIGTVCTSLPCPPPFHAVHPCATHTRCAYHSHTQQARLNTRSHMPCARMRRRHALPDPSTAGGCPAQVNWPTTQQLTPLQRCN